MHPDAEVQKADPHTFTLERPVYTIGSATRSLYIRRGSSDTHLVGQVIVDRAFDLTRLPRIEELRVLLSECRAGGVRPLIIDAGANIGLSSVALSAQCPDALVVAIEPEPGNFQLLVANTEGLPVLPLPCALADTPGCCVIEDPGAGEWGYRTHAASADSTGANLVGTVTIDEILDAHAGECVPFIAKLDIEGAESDVFAGEASWVDRVPLIIVEPHDWMLPRQRSAQPLFRRLARADRDFVWIGDNLFSMAIDLPRVAAHMPRAAP